MPTERRKHPRQPLAVRLHWRLVDLGSPLATAELADAGMQPAVTVDVSDGGIAFLVPCELPLGAPLALQLARDLGGPPLSALGRVARCEERSEGWLVGVELTWVEATQPSAGLGGVPETAWTLL
ncbi:MAG: PilZ domain-containing protein [Planctomycetes bacterium]|nr:PilZ domain-containing protein [Planctomycetota bacterium]